MADMKKKAKDFYESKEHMFEGVREAGAVLKGAAKKVGSAIKEKMPKMSDPPTQTNHIYKVQGPFPGQDMTPTTRMNSPKKYKKG